MTASLSQLAELWRLRARLAQARIAETTREIEAQEQAHARHSAETNLVRNAMAQQAISAPCRLRLETLRDKLTGRAEAALLARRQFEISNAGHKAQRIRCERHESALDQEARQADRTAQARAEFAPQFEET